MTRKAREHHLHGNHFDLPGRLDRRIAYFDFLASYCEVADAFIERLIPHLESDAYAAWAEVVDRWYPGFAPELVRAICF